MSKSKYSFQIKYNKNMLAYLENNPWKKVFLEIVFFDIIKISITSFQGCLLDFVFVFLVYRKLNCKLFSFLFFLFYLVLLINFYAESFLTFSLKVIHAKNGTLTHPFSEFVSLIYLYKFLCATMSYFRVH